VWRLPPVRKSLPPTGSGTWLDYTIIGRDVNLASRVASLRGTLDQELLVSKAFCQRAPAEQTHSPGRFALKGLSAEEEIFVIST